MAPKRTHAEIDMAMYDDRICAEYKKAKARVNEVSEKYREFLHDVNDGNADEDEHYEFTDEIMAEAKHIQKLFDNAVTAVVNKYGADELISNEFGEQLLNDYYDNLKSEISPSNASNAAESFRNFYEECSESFSNMRDAIKEDIEENTENVSDDLDEDVRARISCITEAIQEEDINEDPTEVLEDFSESLMPAARKLLKSLGYEQAWAFYNKALTDFAIAKFGFSPVSDEWPCFVNR